MLRYPAIKIWLNEVVWRPSKLIERFRSDSAQTDLNLPYVVATPVIANLLLSRNARHSGWWSWCSPRSPIGWQLHRGERLRLSKRASSKHDARQIVRNRIASSVLASAVSGIVNRATEAGSRTSHARCDPDASFLARSLCASPQNLRSRTHPMANGQQRQTKWTGCSSNWAWTAVAEPKISMSISICDFALRLGILIPKVPKRVDVNPFSTNARGELTQAFPASSV